MAMKDGTGPRGMGPRTGRGLGPCGSGKKRGFGYGRGSGYGQGFDYGRGKGSGKGMGRCGYDYGCWDYPVTEEAERSLLENQILIIKEKLKVLEERLASLSKKAE